MTNVNDVDIEGFQLSPQQRSLWQLLQRESDQSVYRSECAVRIRGPLDVAALRAALQDVTARQEILRTTFHVAAGMMPLQVIGDPHTTADDVTISESASTAVDDRSLSIAMPAMRCDLPGLKHLVADIVHCYGARVTGTAPPDVGLQYADASIWLNETLSSPETAAGRRFWESQEFGQRASVRLPFERDRGNSPFRPERLPLTIDAPALARIKDTSARHGVSVDVFLLTCWQCLLQRTLTADCLVVAWASDGRSYAELDSAIGPFASSLPLSGNFPLNQPFAAGMKRIADAVRETTQWGECFDRRLLENHGGAPHLPLVFERQDWQFKKSVGGVTFEIEQAQSRADRFTLKLCALGAADDLNAFWLEYDSSTLSKSDVARLAAQLERLVDAAATDADTPLARLPLLPPGQLDEIVADGESRSTFGTAQRTVHQLFEDQAAHVPGRTAVVCENESLTYGVLNARANQLAHHLRNIGVGPETLVGLCLGRSVDVVVGILGILKAGGAYVPLDPKLPRVRLAGMIAEVGITSVISREAEAPLLPASVRTILLDRDSGPLSAQPAQDPIVTIEMSNLVYVLFTSGSTGKPKGVGIEHGQLSDYVAAVGARLDVPAGAAFATVTTFAADLGNTAVYPALTSGGTLHIISEERASDPNAFAAYTQHHSIDVLKIVPSHLKALLSGTQSAAVLPRQRLVLGGEIFSWELADEVHRIAPACEVFNHYGPTETTVGATMYRVEFDRSRPPTASVPIGSPLDGRRVFVIDCDGQVVPYWVAGELHIGGAGVARGYVADEALTQSKFVVCPYVNEHDRRVYRTGDRVRLLPGGILEFLGRIDGQVKIRGFRVEPGEIESSLRRHPAVKDAIVLASDEQGASRLGAFVVYREGRHTSASELKAFLAESLPDYMVPAAFVELDALPLTPNGKIDRHRLPELLHNSAAAVASAEPLTDWESAVAEVWQNFLGIDQIHSRDNFYDLGGDSLMAIQVVTALERRVQVQVSPRDLVFHTLKQFAALCASKQQPQP